MKKAILLLAIFGTYININSQTNSFPSDGNVGIGTTNPNEKLQVNGNINTYDGNIILNNSGVNQVDSGTIRWNEYHNTNKSGAFIKYNGYGNYLQFMTNTENIEYEHLRINRGGNFLIQPVSGNVGIGTISPTSKLDVRTTTNKGIKLNFNDESAITFVPNNGNSIFHLSHGHDNRLHLSQGATVGQRKS